MQTWYGLQLIYKENIGNKNVHEILKHFDNVGFKIQKSTIELIIGF